jgi:signal transduction histidine kinase
MDQATVVLVSDDAEFARAVTGRWQNERTSPAFTLMGGDLCRDLRAEDFDVAIVGAVRSALLPTVLKALEATGCPVVFAGEDIQQVQTVHEAQPRIMVLAKHEGWLDALVLVTSEALRRCEAVARARGLEQANSQLERQAALGRYILEMRHTLNNALTSILGNAELLLLEPATPALGARAQLETVRNMAVRMHEILQRFSSIDKELSVLEKQPDATSTAKSQAAVASS